MEMHICFLGGKVRPINQLHLAMLLDRAEIARSKIFIKGVEWKVKSFNFEMILS